MSDEAYEAYLAKCAHFKMKPSSKEELERNENIDREIPTHKEEEMETTVGTKGVKRCVKCNYTLSTDEFYGSKSCKDGLSSWCKMCTKKATQKKNKDDSEKETDQNQSKELRKTISLEKAKALIKEAYKLGYEDALASVGDVEVDLNAILDRKVAS